MIRRCYGCEENLNFDGRVSFYCHNCGTHYTIQGNIKKDDYDITDYDAKYIRDYVKKIARLEEERPFLIFSSSLLSIFATVILLYLLSS